MTVTEVELFTNCCFRCTHWPGIYGPSPPSYVKASYKAGMMVTALASLLLPQFSSTSGANTLWELHLSPTTSMTTLSRDSLIHLFRPSDSVCTNTVVDIHSFIHSAFFHAKLYRFCTGSVVILSVSVLYWSQPDDLRIIRIVLESDLDHLLFHDGELG